MKLLVIADEDTFLKRLTMEPADVLVACGDLGDQTILQAARTVQCSHVFAVKGNHDSATPFAPPITDLHLRVENVDGITFGGFCGSWRYKPRGHFLYDQDEVERLLAAFPPVDVFVAHNSPRQVHDKEDDVHFGFDGFASYIQRAQPRLFLHGHQHVNRETQLGHTRIVGVYGAQRLELPWTRGQAPG